MNCVIHTDVPAAAYCRTCGRALCEQCKRDVKGVIYCEDCIASRVQGTLPAVPLPPAAALPAAGPNSALATILAVFFPFGVAQVYLGQYAKGLAHMLIFGFLVFGASAGGGLEPLFGVSIFFFYVYQIIDANRSAKALARGEPAPDPFGLARAFSGVQPATPANVPIGAVVLIALGALFLFSNLGLFHFRWIGRMWPVILIAIGIWMFTRRNAPGGTQ